MNDTKKVRYLKVDRGRYFYQRRIPLSLRDSFPDEDVWRRPCGDVTYPKAIQLVVTWAEEHDKLIEKLKDPVERDAYAAKARQELANAENAINMREGSLAELYMLPPSIIGTDIADGKDTQPNWLWAKASLKELETRKTGENPTKNALAQFIAILSSWQSGKKTPSLLNVPNFQKFRHLVEIEEFSRFREFVSFEAHQPKPLTDVEYTFELKSIFDAAFGKHAPKPPSNSDDLEEHFFIRNKIERKISEATPNPNTVSATLEKYISFNQIRPLSSRKYRRDVSRLTSMFGDLPVNQITPAHLKELRESLITEIKPASLHSVFTPIKGLLRHAFTEGLIDFNPMSAVALPKDKRPIEERKWKKFEPHEAQKIYDLLTFMRENEVQGLTEERRKAFVMVVRALMFTGMRPIEVLRLQPADVSARAIHITGSKTESSTRIIPVHPELQDFPEWVKSGGLSTYQNIGTDKVGAVRHNFTRMLRKSIQPPILDEQKTLYSLRSTFVNAMRRAGADIQMQRAILGHKESGAIRHYDDGPEFKKKFDAVSRTDPRKQ